MDVNKLIELLQKLKKDDRIHIMLDGSDYGEVKGIIEKRGIYYLATEFEIIKAAPDNILVPDEKEAENNG